MTTGYTIATDDGVIIAQVRKTDIDDELESKSYPDDYDDKGDQA